MATETQMSLKEAYLNSQSSVVWEAASLNTSVIKQDTLSELTPPVCSGTLTPYTSALLFLMLLASILYKPNTIDFLTKEQYGFQWILKT